MKKNICIVTGVVLVIILLSVGISFRRNIKDTYNTEEGRDNLYIACMEKSLLEMLGYTKEFLQESKIIIKAKSLGGSEYVYENLKQEVEVQQVIRGGEYISEGDRVYIVGTGERYKNEEGNICVNCKFMNFMQEGEEYLIFIDEKLDWSIEEDIAFYNMNKDALTMQYINLNRNQSEVCKKEGKFQLYKDVKQFEFYTNDEEVLKLLNQIKEELIEEYIK